jgi:hypothetical protein
MINIKVIMQTCQAFVSIYDQFDINNKVHILISMPHLIKGDHANISGICVNI